MARLDKMKPQPCSFVHFTNYMSRVVGSFRSFLMALFIVVIWIASGPLFQFSDTWQLIINTSTTIVTFLMVFLGSVDIWFRDAKSSSIEQKFYSG